MQLEAKKELPPSKPEPQKRPFTPPAPADDSDSDYEGPDAITALLQRHRAQMQQNEIRKMIQELNIKIEKLSSDTEGATDTNSKYNNTLNKPAFSR